MYLFQDFKDVSFLKIAWGILIGNTRRAAFLFRLSSWCFNHKLRPLAIFFSSLNVALHSCDISPKAKIGPGLLIMHSVGIVVGEVIIGKNLTIMQNVTIGSIDGGRMRESAIGDNVNLNSGCCILARIGDNVSVGANAVVLNDVPSNSTAVGVPARIIDKTKLKYA